MKTSSNNMILSAALVGIMALSAPLAASAQSQRAPDHRAPAVNERQVQSGHSTNQGRPTVNAPQQHQTQRPTQNTVRALQTGTYRVTSTVNIRERASTQSRRVGQARARSTVQIDRVSGNWLHIKNKGWISAQYAEPMQNNGRNSQPSRH